jgi:superfamily II DNA or RNA helicase
MQFAPGSLVNARDREWVVLPDSTGDLLKLRPLSGTDDDIAGICPDLEEVIPADFDYPDPGKLGDEHSCRLLRDAVRLGFRSSAGPFRSMANLAVDPRPYQLVPLLMALRMDPVRIMVADDVGIGKTIEAGLIARELLDRGEVSKLVVLCPRHLTEQWQSELKDKFHIDAELVTTGNIRKLERRCRANESVFDIYPYLIVSIDFIKSDRHKDDFIRACPDLVIVDEAHTCSFGDDRGKQRRHEIVKRLSEKPERHLILVTATPHSGKETAFRSLLCLLNPEFEHLPDELGGKDNERHRRRLASHFVQRRRGDIRHYLEQDTQFPERMEKEANYSLSEGYQKLFDRVIRYTRDSVQVDGLSGHKQRVRWWAALAMLRSLGSSPAAAAVSLRKRADTLGADDKNSIDERGEVSVMDLMDSDTGEASDITPGADYIDSDDNARRRLLDMAKDAEALMGAGDNKLTECAKQVKKLIKDDFHPIIFCRFIDTAQYVAEELRKKLPKGVEVVAITGLQPPEERERLVEEMAGKDKRVLVATDCLSEGINLQHIFNAVLHYDLSWNPTRHEQREGRVDRFGQPSDEVRIIRYFGRDNKIDGIVLDVLLRKHATIRTSLGISVPLPVRSEDLLEAVFEGLLLREQQGSQADQLYLSFFEPEKQQIHEQWEAASEKEKKSRTLFAQHAIKPDEVSLEMALAREAIGSGAELRRFVINTLKLHRGIILSEEPLHVKISECPQAMRDMMGLPDSKEFTARFDLPVKDGQLYLSRTHPLVEGLASYVMDTAFDALAESRARRCGVIHTPDVDSRTTLLLLRMRYHLESKHDDKPMLAEECLPVAFRGAPNRAEWLTQEDAEALLKAQAKGNQTLSASEELLERMIGQIREGALTQELERIAGERADSLLEAHKRVRKAARIRGDQNSITPKLPVDILGLYVYLPAN